MDKDPFQGIHERLREALESRGFIEAHHPNGQENLIDGIRIREDGEGQNVVIEIHDSGPDYHHGRYRWRVSVPNAEHSEVLSSNGSFDPYLAGSAGKVHWFMLETSGRRDLVNA